MPMLFVCPFLSVDDRKSICLELKTQATPPRSSTTMQLSCRAFLPKALQAWRSKQTPFPLRNPDLCAKLVRTLSAHSLFLARHRRLDDPICGELDTESREVNLLWDPAQYFFVVVLFDFIIRPSA